MKTRTEKIMEQHTLALSGREVVIHTVTVTTRRLECPTEASLRALLDKLAKCPPCDRWQHVIETLKRGKTYLLRRGWGDHAAFIGSGRKG